MPLVHDALGPRELGPAGERSYRRGASGSWPRKGNLMPGADADVLVLDPELEWTVDPTSAGDGRRLEPVRGQATARARDRGVLTRRPGLGDGRRAGAAPGHGRFVAANTAREPAACLRRRLRCRGWRQEAILRPAREQPRDRRGPREPGRLRGACEGRRATAPQPGGDRRRPAAARETATRWWSSRVSRLPVLAHRLRSPAVLLANGNLVGRWATPEIFYELERQNLIAWGGLTAGCWQYIGAQGCCRAPMRPSLRWPASTLAGR